MGRYILKRALLAIPTLLLISFSIFMFIQLPPGSYVEVKIEEMKKEGQVDMAEVNQLVNRYKLDKPAYVQYTYWMGGLLKGDMGESFVDKKDVTDILAERLPPTATISILTILLTWTIAVPFGIFAAVKKNTVWDYLLTFIGLAAMATPGFVLALVFQMISVHWAESHGTTFDPSGLFSREYLGQPWSIDKILDMMKHIWIPVVILGVAGTAGMIRILRANVIDELRKQYVLCARARGLHPVMVILRYPVRVAINPMISNIGLVLPTIISGTLIIAKVLNLETVGPKLLTALQNQDTYLAASIVFMECVLAVIGILISDILLSMVDPRIKFGSK
ncbi:MAG: ABC transporter permease [Planctomycetes bacterium]|nr:ABC transporter permease [Planctomycetota bacterium]